MGIQVEKGDTLWGIAKRSVQAQIGEDQKVTNQQIVDEMHKIAQDNGYDNVDDCVNANFYAKDGKFGSLNVKGLEVESAKGSSGDVPDKDGATDEASVKTNSTDVKSALEYTTLGAGGTFAVKAALKVGKEIKKKNVKNAAKKVAAKSAATAKKVADGTKKVAKKLKGKVEGEKVKRARNGQAAKIRDARRAADANKAAKDVLKAEQAKLKSLKANKASADAIKAQEKVVQKAKEKSKKATEAMKAKRKAAGLNQTTGKPLKNKKIVKTPGGKIAKASAKKSASKGAAKAVAKTGAKKAAAKAVAKAGGKTLLKKIPGVGLLAGLAFAADRAYHGDWAGAVGEVASGAVACVPGIGTAASVAIDAGLMYRDVKKS